ncbi:tRNA (adenosine(37)-N6)-threonylcarbamoyltransferase complex transferase subunit TsaD [Patescibacteria group bacterium]|nr:tRNA (adenosine(37)-N6)-threonylcarbamoyltransferase complex transferase subunit TsaD [Patescibacteria group bacterium]
MLILGIETSCDETAAAIIRTKNNRINILADVICSQIKEHKKFGGVVPQVAAGLHQKNIVKVLDKVFKKAKTRPPKIDLIAVTAGPGLIPALLVGVSAAKTLAWKWQKPIVGVNHMEGHIVAAMLPMSNVKCQMSKPKMPALALLVSGGHTQLVLMRKCLKYEIIGETRDDAAGEAFDKVGKMLGLGYPAGAKIEQLAKKGNVFAFNFPSPMIKSDNYDFSFSGLKTAVSNAIELLKQNNKKLSRGQISDIAASFQVAVIDVLASKTVRAAKEYNARTFIIGGGVAANETLRHRLKKALSEDLPQINFLMPRKEYTGDNAVMIALAGYFRYKVSRFRLGQAGKREDVQADANLKLK